MYYVRTGGVFQAGPDYNGLPCLYAVTQGGRTSNLTFDADLFTSEAGKAVTIDPYLTVHKIDKSSKDF